MIYDGWRLAQASTLRNVSVIVLLLAAMLQAKIVARAHRRRLPGHRLALYRQPIYRRWAFAGLVACYGFSLLLTRHAEARYAFAAALSVWYTAALLPLASENHIWRHLAAARQTRWMVRFGHAGFAVAVLLPAVELGIRLHDLAASQPVSQRFALHQHTLPPGSEWQGWRVNRAGYCDREFPARRRAGTFRLAVIGDAMLLSGNEQTNVLGQLEHRLGDLEALRFALPAAGPREYATVLAQDVASYRPDLVVVFITLADDVLSDREPPHLLDFDWQGLRLCQWSAAMLSQRGGLSVSALPLRQWPDYEHYLRQAATQLSICRATVRAETAEGWRRTFEQLERLAEESARRAIPLALVLIPCRYQVERHLRDQLCRRAGCRPEQIDLGLPQRRMIEFAASHDIPLLDLLPHLQAADATLYVRHGDDWNDAGNRVVAQTLARWLRSQFGIPRAAELVARDH